LRKILLALALLPLSATAQTTDDLNSTGSLLNITGEGININSAGVSLSVGTDGQVFMSDGNSTISTNADGVYMNDGNSTLSSGSTGVQIIQGGDIVNTNRTLNITANNGAKIAGSDDVNFNIDLTNGSKKKSQNTHSRENGKRFVNDALVNQNNSGRDFSNGEFINTDISNVNFAGANLSGARFSNGKYSNVNFTGANLSGATFSNIEVTSTDMSNAVMTNICFTNTDFSDSQMVNTDLSGSVLRNTDFFNVDLAGAKRNQILPKGSKCRDINYGKFSSTTKNTKRPSITSAKEIVSQLSKKSGTIDLTVNFMTNSDQLFGSAHAQVTEIAKAISNRKLQGKNIQIQGHTDSDGSDDYNYDLSYRRATTVQRALTQDYGINANNLSIQGFGESRPVASNNDANGRAYNRRVTLVVL
jgi:outer membrane protein OmpA-like peptidoglycan-associated protein